MALRTNPKTLKNLRYHIPTEKDAFSIGYFQKTYEGLRNLRELDLNSEKGVKKYLGMLREPSAKAWDTETLEKTHKTLVQMAGSGFLRNSVRNAGGIANILDEETRVEYALTVPSFTIRGDKPYNGVSRAITYMQDVNYDIQNNTKEYANKRLNGIDKNSKPFWAAVMDVVMEGDKKLARQKATDNLVKYGSAKYIKQDVQRAAQLSEMYSGKVSRLGETMRKAVETRTKALGRPLNATEHAAVIESFKKREEDMNKRYANAARAYEALPKMVGTLQSTAYETLKAKKKKK